MCVYGFRSAFLLTKFFGLWSRSVEQSGIAPSATLNLWNAPACEITFGARRGPEPGRSNIIMTSSAPIQREPTLTLSPTSSGATGQDRASGHHAGDNMGLCSFVVKPPIETVAFGWGVNEDGQLGLMETGSASDKGEKGQNPFVMCPKVVEGLLGTKFRGRVGSRSPLVAGSRNTMVVTADGQVCVSFVVVLSSPVPCPLSLCLVVSRFHLLDPISAGRRLSFLTAVAHRLNSTTGTRGDGTTGQR